MADLLHFGRNWLTDAMLCSMAPDGRSLDGKSITCPECGRTSHNPTDVAEGYCGACKGWTSGRIRLITNSAADDTVRPVDPTTTEETP